MIYTDGTHLITNGDLDELHDFAGRIGLRRSWFQGPPQHSLPHYDILSKRILQVALARGAKQVTAREIVRINR